MGNFSASSLSMRNRRLSQLITVMKHIMRLFLVNMLPKNYHKWVKLFPALFNGFCCRSNGYVLLVMSYFVYWKTQKRKIRQSYTSQAKKSQKNAKFVILVCLKRKIAKNLTFVDLATLKRKLIALRKIVKFGTDVKNRKIRCRVQSWTQLFHWQVHCRSTVNSVGKKPRENSLLHSTYITSFWFMIDVCNGKFRKQQIKRIQTDSWSSFQLVFEKVDIA